MALWATLIATFWYAVGPAGGGAVIYAPHLRIRCITLVTHLPTFGSYCRYIIRHPSCHLLTSRHLTPKSLLRHPQLPKSPYSSPPTSPMRHIPRPPSCYLSRYFHATIQPPPTSPLTLLPTSPFSPLTMSPSITSPFPSPLTLSPLMSPFRHLLCHFYRYHLYQDHLSCHLSSHLSSHPPKTLSTSPLMSPAKIPVQTQCNVTFTTDS
jgi:hypothetical protein